MSTILLVDDAPDIRLLLRAVLQRSGHHLVEAESGTAALALIEDGLVPDVVILDIQMPGLDGWETLTRMRVHDLGDDVPVLMLSVKASPQDMGRAWQLGCDGYLTKPFDIGDLAREVQAIAAMTPTERATLRRVRLAAALEQSREMSV